LLANLRDGTLGRFLGVELIRLDQHALEIEGAE
jgi:hypothetical protein